MQQTTTIKTSSCKQAYIYLFPRESLPGLHLGCSENSVTLSGCSSLYNDIPNAICSHGHNNKVYLPRSVCHPSLFLHVFPRNLHRVRLSLPRISPHPVCLSFEIHEQHQSWSCILLFLHVHMFNSLPLQCCGNTQVPLQSYWICSFAIGALTPIWAASRDTPLGAVQGRLDELWMNFRDHKRAALLQVWM